MNQFPFGRSFQALQNEITELLKQNLMATVFHLRFLLLFDDFWAQFSSFEYNIWKIRVNWYMFRTFNFFSRRNFCPWSPVRNPWKNNCHCKNYSIIMSFVFLSHKNISHSHFLFSSLEIIFSWIPDGGPGATLTVEPRANNKF